MDLKSTKRKHEAFLRRLPNVVGVGIGPKTRDGQRTAEMAIRVYVSRKVPAEALPPDERIPSQHS